MQRAEDYRSHDQACKDHSGGNNHCLAPATHETCGFKETESWKWNEVKDGRAQPRQEDTVRYGQANNIGIEAHALPI